MERNLRLIELGKKEKKKNVGWGSYRMPGSSQCMREWKTSGSRTGRVGRMACARRIIVRPQNLATHRVGNH